MEIENLEEYMRGCFEEIEGRIKRKEYTSAKKFLEESIHKLENWWGALPPLMKEHFGEKRYLECHGMLISLLEELSMHGY